MKKFRSILIGMIVAGAVSSFAKDLSVHPDSIRYHFAPVVVTGQRFEMPQKDIAASISIISPTAIRQTHLITVADAISYLSPGVYTTRRLTMGYGVAALAGGSITIRGLGGKPNSQVLMLIDGRPDFQGIFSHPISDAYFLDNVDHIEVLRGPASAVYGTNALGGVVNIITQKLPTAGFENRLNISYGSYNTQRYRFQHGGAIGRAQYLLSIGHQQSEGHRENSQFEAQNYSLQMGYQIDPHFHFSFNGTITPYTYHDPGPEGVSLSGYFDYGKITRSSLDVTLTNHFAGSEGTVKIHGNFGKHRLSDGWSSDDQTNGLIAFQNFELPWAFKSTVGLDIKRYGGTSRSNGIKLGTFFNDEYALYLHLQKTWLKKWILAGGIRLEDNSNFGREWIPKFGLVYHAGSQTSLRTTVAKGFRAPSIKDLFLFAPANKYLQPERLWSYEVGINQSFGRQLSLDVCGFYYQGDQFIETTPIAPGRMQNLNTGANRVSGLEVTLAAMPLPNFSANFGYSYLHSEEAIPFAPNKLNFMITYAFKKFSGSIYGEHIRALYTSYQLNQMPPKISIEQLPNYTLLHVKLNYQLRGNLQLSAGIENLMDQSYQILKGYPMPGRTAISNFTFSF